MCVCVCTRVPRQQEQQRGHRLAPLAYNRLQHDRTLWAATHQVTKRAQRLAEQRGRAHVVEGQPLAHPKVMPYRAQLRSSGYECRWRCSAKYEVGVSGRK